jgi:hypothetical protein
VHSCTESGCLTFWAQTFLLGSPLGLSVQHMLSKTKSYIVLAELLDARSESAQLIA